MVARRWWVVGGGGSVAVRRQGAHMPCSGNPWDARKRGLGGNRKLSERSTRIICARQCGPPPLAESGALCAPAASGQTSDELGALETVGAEARGRCPLAYRRGETRRRWRWKENGRSTGDEVARSGRAPGSTLKRLCPNATRRGDCEDTRRGDAPLGGGNNPGKPGAGQMASWKAGERRR